jgi:hypothetical protein
LKPARRHYKLNDDVIKKVRFLAEYGAPLEHIAPAAGVSFPALRMWLLNAKGPDPTREEVALLAAINEGRSKGGMRLISTRSQSKRMKVISRLQHGCSRIAQHLGIITAIAAVNRARQEGIEAALQAVAESGLPPDQERIVVLRIAAKTGHNAASS